MSHASTVAPTLPLILGALLLTTAPLAADPSGWYLEARAGQSSLEGRFGDRFPKLFDDEADTSSIEVGYGFNDYFAVQAGYHDLGSFTGAGAPCPDDAEGCIGYVASPEDLILCAEPLPCILAVAPIEADIDGWSLTAVPSWPFNDRWSAFGKIGLLDWRGDLSTGFPFVSSSRLGSVSDTDLVTGLGLRYRFGNRLGAVAEYRRLDLDLASATLGLSWDF